MQTTALPAVTKTYRRTFVGGPASGRTRRECWSATTIDGRWTIERIEDVGTPWIVVTADGAELPALFGTLKSALKCIATGQADRLLNEGD